MDNVKVKNITLREWFYMAAAHSNTIRKGYDQFLPADIHRIVNAQLVYNEQVFDYYRETFPDIDKIKKKELFELSQDEYNFIDFDKSIVYLPKFFWLNFRENFMIDGNIGKYFENESNQNYLYKALDNERTKIHNFIVSAKPRLEQEELFHLAKETIKNNVYNFRGIIKAPPGVGKTFMSLKLISNIKSRTLIVVPNDVLLKQWVQSIKEFSNFKEEDIGFMQGSDANYLLRESQKEVCIIIINSLYSQIKRLGYDYCHDLYENFGLVFIDEVHVAGGAESFSKSFSVFKTNHIIGLTATPYRKGINDFLLEHSIGPIFWESSHQNLIPNIHIHNNYIQFDPNAINKMQYFKNDYIRFLVTYNAALYENTPYFEYLADWVNYRLHEGHKVILIFATNKMVFKMEKTLKYRYKIDSGVIIGDTEKETKKPEKPKWDQDMLNIVFAHYLNIYPKKKVLPNIVAGDTIKKGDYKIIDDINHFLLENNLPEIGFKIEEVESKSEMEIAKSCQVIIGNPQMLSAGFDDTMSSCLFICTPLVGKVVTIQSVGRITRTNPNKKQIVHAHFMWSTLFHQTFPDMHWTLIRNLKTGFPDANFHLEGFPTQNSPGLI
jgi:superfamily II DNA or RNA helicase